MTTAPGCRKHWLTIDAPIAVATSCAGCAPLIGNPPQSEHGFHMAIIHLSHVPELAALGWVRTENDDGGPPDIACSHFHAAHWQGGPCGQKCHPPERNRP
jgi:hypothetical protein